MDRDVPAAAATPTATDRAAPSSRSDATLTLPAALVQKYYMTI
jgi:hypothetical protein